MQRKKKIRQNTVFLEQQIYASQGNFTQPLVVIVETFRRSANQSILVLIITDFLSCRNIEKDRHYQICLHPLKIDSFQYDNSPNSTLIPLINYFTSPAIPIHVLTKQRPVRRHVSERWNSLRGRGGHGKKFQILITATLYSRPQQRCGLCISTFKLFHRLRHHIQLC